MTTVTHVEGAWQVHRDGYLICSTTDEAFARDYAEKHKVKTDQSSLEAMQANIQNNSGLDSSLKDEKTDLKS